MSGEQEKNRRRSCFHAISNYPGIRLENASIARSGKLLKNVQENKLSVAFSWSRKTIDELLVFMALTVRNSAGKRSTNATFARSGKL